MEITNNVLELTIERFAEKCKHIRNDQSLSTPKMTVFGIPDCVISFYPKGNFWCTKDDHCSLVFVAPADIKLKLRMYVGTCTRDAEELLTLEDTNEKVYGLNDMCPLSSESCGIDPQSTSAVAVGVEVIEAVWETDDDKESDKVVRVTLE
mmetsp:Transcript_34250/g.84802  ORF Transcript_34250/g.84802 Transcript_34250/m.84802 type:complete len:150 (-) Transcript_34250:238-687(-)